VLHGSECCVATGDMRASARPARHERPCRRAAQQLDELASSHGHPSARGGKPSVTLAIYAHMFTTDDSNAAAAINAALNLPA
jgi:hypothetical protein